MNVIDLKNITKSYGKDQSEAMALNDINLSVQAGEFISIMGPSGSGKSTLLNILGLMDVETSGEYFLKGRLMNRELSNKEISQIRNTMVSFVFQHFALLKNYSVFENVELPLLNRNMSASQRKEKVFAQLERLGMDKFYKKLPTQLSGGQQQRVAIARALVSEAEIILADEPTGALDQKTGKELLELLTEINTEQSKTIILVTHDEKVAQYTNRKVLIHDGRIIEDLRLV